MADKEIVLRNTQRRTIGFCVAGKEVRLAPGEQVRVPATWMRSTELQRFAGAGFVASASAPAERAEDDDGEDEGEKNGDGDEEGEADRPRRARAKGGGRKAGGGVKHPQKSRKQRTKPKD